MEVLYKRPSTIVEDGTHGYCPGCFHGTAVKLVCELIDEMGLKDDTAHIFGIGCAGNAWQWVTFDCFESPHGRAPAYATAYKRTNPNEFVVTYQGDGDLASIGIAEIIHAANRGENFSVVFINNGTYGMTGGQMAPTTLIGQKASTAPFGRIPEQHGYPLDICKLLASLVAPAYLERVTMTDVPNILKAKAAIKKAFQNQLDGKGFSLVEVVSNCPTNWGLSPLETIDYINENTLKTYPLGVYRDKDAGI